MRWDRFFDDLEDQLASEWEAERAALDTEAERLRLSRVALRERLASLIGRSATTTAPSFELSDGSMLSGEVTGAGADWVGLEPSDPRTGALVVPLSAIVAIGMPHADLLRSARPAPPAGLAERMTLGFVLRDLVRRRAGVSLHLTTGRVLGGTIDRAGADHLDIALHERGSSRRTEAVTGHRIVAFSAVAWVRVDADA